ncbi:MAG: SRPBCC family protein [Ginsengibacter sp.]
MATEEKTTITVETIVDAAVEKVWEYWTKPAHITQWNNASDDWHTTHAENDLRAGGSFSARMEAKDGSFGFDFAGIYDAVTTNQYIEYTFGDGRNVQITFTTEGKSTKVAERFEAEGTNPFEIQKGGWQNILDNFKKYTEAN